ncbi:MAG TPA: ABC transporter permease [Planctomycetaceae bacterium]|nr:ABC transporter permease [Planctomycetaceae bacterium]
MYKLILTFRYLRTRFIALASIISVMLGVATMIVVNSVMSGFGEEMRDRLKGILSDVVVTTTSMNGVPDAQHYMNMIEQIGGENIVGITTSVEVYGMMTFQYRGEPWTRPVTLVGIEPRGKASVSPLPEYLLSFQEGRRNKANFDAWAANPWELTDEEMKYRELLYADAAWSDAEHWPDELGEEPTLDPVEGPEFSEVPLSTEPPPFEAGSADTSPAPSKGLEDPFAQLASSSPRQEASSAPLVGRAYIGLGLISYQQTDPRTGKTETVMMLRPGDDVRLSTVGTSLPPSPVPLEVTVTDVLKTGMSEYDSNLVFCNLDYLQKVRGMIHPDPQTGEIQLDAPPHRKDFTTIQIKLKDYSKAPQFVAELKSAFPPGLFVIQTWEDKQGPLLAAVEMESAILNVLLFLIIGVAGFGILAIFFMIVVEKTRDIGIMKALGASAGGIMSIFLSYGLALGIVGSGVGVMLGLLFVRYINEIESVLSKLTGRPVFDEQIYYFSEIPTMVSPWMVFWVAFGAIAIAVLASILPARRAAQLHPVESLRYE